MTFILASQSPARKKILEQIGLLFKVHPAHIDEHHSGFKKPHAIVKSIALRKAQAVSQEYPDAWVIGCDTIVILANGQISLKPAHRKEAETTLRSYQNSHCYVYSGLALVNHSRKVHLVGWEKSRIDFLNFSDDEIKAHLDSGNWKHSSGSINIEDKMHWIKSIKGDYWNIVGLPVNLLKNKLKSLELV